MSRVQIFHIFLIIPDPDLPIHYVVIQSWNEFVLVAIVKAHAVEQQILKLYPQIQRTDASDHVCANQWPVIDVIASFFAENLRIKF